MDILNLDEIPNNKYFKHMKKTMIKFNDIKNLKFYLALDRLDIKKFY